MERFRVEEANLKENPNFRKEFEYLRSDFNFIIGKTYHVLENFQEALNYYSKAIK